MIAVSKEKINRDNARSHSAKSDRVQEYVTVDCQLIPMDRSIANQSFPCADDIIICVTIRIIITHLSNGVQKREPHRVCPTKLSKQELEDLYFALMDTNMDLKRTVNAQQESIKILNTKLNRLMSAQRSCVKEGQCCPQTKAVVNEQRDIIADLKKSNDRMSERIRILNMRLCSAKQFLKHNPSLGKSHCAKCCIAPPASLKNSAMSLRQANNNNKKSEGERKQSASVEPSQDAENDPVSTRTVETETDDPEKESQNAVCNENRCRTLMEELKQKITDLQEESSANNSSYCHRISQLESEMSSLRAMLSLAREEQAAALRNADLLAATETRLAARLREADVSCSEITSLLLMERNKVAELEMRLRAAEMSGQVAKALEKRRSESIDSRDAPPKADDVIIQKQPSFSFRSPVMGESQLQSAPTSVQCSETKVISDFSETKVQDKETEILADSRDTPRKTQCTHCLANSPSYIVLKNATTPSPAKSKHSDDSGYIDHQPSEEERALAKVNAELVKKITDLQEKLDVLRIATAGFKAQQALEATDAKMADADRKTDDTHERVIEKDSKTVKQSRNSGDSERSVYDPAKSTNEGKKESPERAKDMESSDPSPNSPIHRANQLWAQYSGNALQQKEDKIQFSKYNSQSNSHQEIVSAKPPTTEERDSSPSKSSRKTRMEHKKSLDETNMNGYNEIVDKIETSRDDNFGKRNSLSRDLVKPKNREINLNTRMNKTSVEIPISDSLTQDNVRTKEDKQDFNTGVQITDKDIQEIDFRKIASSDKIRKREYGIDHTMHDMLNDRERKTQKTTRKSTDDEAASLSLRPTSAEGAVPADRAVSEDATPDNTDHEISHLSDLPPEHDVLGKTPRYAMSPGEQMTSKTYTDTYTETSDPHSISEGEVLLSSGECPVSAGRRSIGETRDEAVETKASRTGTSVSQQMEQALQSITEELARCRELLQNTRPETRTETRGTSTTCPSRVALKHSAASPRLVQPAKAWNKCTFTLHIGTLVLSDEAVVYSRDKSLLLTWKFYDQTVAMTRMRNGRVILFDFTTEYDAYMDERFTDYLKYEEMPIVICELNKQNCPFAVCSLPFRDVLLNPNHRVDMSLALTVGPDMRRPEAPRSKDSLVASDEVGVLDLWCMLRKRSSQSELRRAQPPLHEDSNNIMDRRSDEYRMSEEQYRENSVRMPAATRRPHGSLAPPMATPVQNPLHPLDDGSLAKYTVQPDKLSTVVPQEMTTNIRSSQESKKVQDDKRRSDEYLNQSIKRLEKLEDDVLSQQPRQSVSSWAKFLKRHSRSHKDRSSSQPSDDFETLLNIKPKTKFNSVPNSGKEEPVIDQNYDKDAHQKRAVSLKPRYSEWGWEQPQQVSAERVTTDKAQEISKESIVLTIIWLALNEECSAMTDASVQRLYVAFSLLGRSGAEYETPVSLPKPRNYGDKCVFNFRKSIQLRQCDLPQLGHMGRCKRNDTRTHNPNDCIVFTVISEPAEDPLGLASCEDIGYAYLYLGDVLSNSVSETYVEVVPVHSARSGDEACGVLCVQIDGLELVRKAARVNLA